jgi:hypothetical protein
VENRLVISLFNVHISQHRWRQAVFRFLLLMPHCIISGIFECFHTASSYCRFSVETKQRCTKLNETRLYVLYPMTVYRLCQGVLHSQNIMRFRGARLKSFHVQTHRHNKFSWTSENILFQIRWKMWKTWTKFNSRPEVEYAFYCINFHETRNSPIPNSIHIRKEVWKSTGRNSLRKVGMSLSRFSQNSSMLNNFF